MTVFSEIRIWAACVVMVAACDVFIEPLAIEGTPPPGTTSVMLTVGFLALLIDIILFIPIIVPRAFIVAHIMSIFGLLNPTLSYSETDSYVIMFLGDIVIFSLYALAFRMAFFFWKRFTHRSQK